VKEKLIALLKAAGVSDEKIAEMKATLDAFKVDEVTPPAKTTTTQEPDVETVALRKEVKELKDLLNKEVTERQQGIVAQKERTENELKAKREALIAKALKEGKIPEAKKEWLTKLAEKAYDEAESFVNDAPVMAGFKPAVDDKGKPAGEQGGQGGQQAQTPGDLRAAAAAAFGSGTK